VKNQSPPLSELESIYRFAFSSREPSAQLTTLGHVRLNFPHTEMFRSGHKKKKVAHVTDHHMTGGGSCQTGKVWYEELITGL